MCCHAVNHCPSCWHWVGILTQMCHTLFPWDLQGGSRSWNLLFEKGIPISLDLLLSFDGNFIREISLLPDRLWADWGQYMDLEWVIDISLNIVLSLVALFLQFLCNERMLFRFSFLSSGFKSECSFGPTLGFVGTLCVSAPVPWQGDNGKERHSLVPHEVLMMKETGMRGRHTM